LRVCRSGRSPMMGRMRSRRACLCPWSPVVSQ
jgi:hypothetical protein